VQGALKAPHPATVESQDDDRRADLGQAAEVGVVGDELPPAISALISLLAL